MIANFPETPRAGSSLEEELLGKWFPRIGALAVVLGAGFGYKYAVDQGWVGAGLRVFLGILASSILLGIGDWSHRRGWLAYAQAITAGGIGLLYLTLWASYDIYGLVPSSVAFTALVGASALGCALALRHDSQALALLAVIGGFVNPFVTGISTEMPTGLYLYALSIDVAVIALSFVRSWRFLERFAFVASWVVFAVGDGDPRVAVATATALFLMFGILPYVRALLRFETSTIDDIGFVVTNGLIYFFAVFVRLTGDLAALQGPFTLILAGVFFGGAALLSGRGSEVQILRAASAAMAFFFALLWPPVQFEGGLIAFGWSIMAVVLFAARGLGGKRELGWAAWALLSLGMLAQLLTAAIDPVAAVDVDLGRYVFVLVIVGLYAGSYFESKQEAEFDLAGAGVVLANLITLYWFSLEAYSALSHQGHVVPDVKDFQFALSAIWGLYAGALMVVGVAARSRAVRLMSVGLFGVVVVKMGVHDLWLLDTLQRLVGFVGIGVLLLASSLMYHRFKAFLLGGDLRDGTPV